MDAHKVERADQPVGREWAWTRWEAEVPVPVRIVTIPESSSHTASSSSLSLSSSSSSSSSPPTPSQHQQHQQHQQKHDSIPQNKPLDTNSTTSTTMSHDAKRLAVECHVPPIEVVCKAVDTSYNEQPERMESIYNVRGVLVSAWHRVKIGGEGGERVEVVVH